MSKPATKEWVKVAHAANGTTTVTVSIVQENLSVRWAVKTYTNQIKAGLVDARAGANKAMADLRQALGELAEDEAA